MPSIALASGLCGTAGQPWPGVRYFCTQRQGGVSQPPWDGLNLGLHVQDDPLAVRANRASLLQSVPSEPLWLEQVHGTQVCEADVGGVWCATGVPCADAAVTTVRNRPLAIMTADCLPVVLADDAGSVLGVAHAGWRGLAAGVLENVVAVMRRRALRATGWRAWVGPAIGQEAFEVGDEVFHAFVDPDPQAATCFARWPGTQRWHADLAGLARRRLKLAGVARVELSGECTYRQADRYFSYRRETPTGRQATLAWLV
ncbi:MAG TPA: peptidoglycan editing factor PgeF [Castellaniella sp.]